MQSRSQVSSLFLCAFGLATFAAAQPVGGTSPPAADTKFTAPREATPETRQQIDQLREKLEAGKTTVEKILTDPAYMPLHELTPFRELIRKHAPKTSITLVTRDEPGTKMFAKGTIRDDKGKPAAGALVYAYHTSDKGWYSDRAAHYSANAGDVKHARLFGYVIADDQGRFELITIRPQGYPATDLPAHIHIEFIVGGVSRLVSEIQFDDDPRLTPAWREQSKKDGFVIAKVEKDESKTQRVAVEFTLPPSQ